MSTQQDFDTDVFIVGAGPMGATAALALATYGVRVHAVTRYRWLSNSPRAHITNQRAMEVMRDLGIAEELRRYGSSWDLMGDTLFTTSFAGEEIARIRTWGTGDERHGDYVAGSPEGMLDVPQPSLESVLVKNAAERGANFSFNTEYLSHRQDGDGVTVRLRDRITDREYELRARYLIGAEGARSRIVEELGLPIEGRMGRANTAYVRFTADLSRYVAHRPSILYWILTPDTSYGEIGMGLLRAVHPWNEWIAGWGYDPAQGDPDLSEPVVAERIRTLVGDPGLELSITDTSTWQVNEAYATLYSRGRVFCGGDAVHRHPPSGGLGSNTCVQDAFNLAWKLAFVIRGDAEPALLDSYSLERAPVGKQIVLRANASRRDFAAFQQVVRVEGAVDPAGAGLERLRDPGPEGAAAREALQRAMEVKNYEFNAQGVESNQRYLSDAILPDGSEPETWVRDPELYLQASTRPGAKLPHAWVVDESGRRISTLDLVGRGAFSLVTGLSGTAWTAAAAAIEGLRSVVIGAEGAQDLYGAWYRAGGIHDGGALLVRPDGYVAWRHADPVWDAEQAAAMLGGAFDAILGRKGAS